jgi:hypothetical protein
MPSKLTKSPKFGVIFQLTKTATAEGADYEWEVHDVERPRAFHVTLPHAELAATGTGAKPRTWTEAEIERAVLVALERALEAPPEKVPGEVYEVTVTRADLLVASAA